MKQVAILGYNRERRDPFSNRRKLFFQLLFPNLKDFPKWGSGCCGGFKRILPFFTREQIDREKNILDFWGIKKDFPHPKMMLALFWCQNKPQRFRIINYSYLALIYKLLSHGENSPTPHQRFSPVKPTLSFLRLSKRKICIGTCPERDKTCSGRRSLSRIGKRWNWKRFQNWVEPAAILFC